ncbi:HNH endonuclease [Chitinophaga sp. HK235]|uniref:HNH endonuclease signature motif containing protein n=1 Tax=Chitinophaga sp. HK235 TaxID=2952571 RepID=UPI001BA7063E|nr:HNH endonuclease [Chitinophaga sp. HK235]
MRPVNKGTAADNGYAYNSNSIINFSRTKFAAAALALVLTDTPTAARCSTFLLSIIDIPKANLTADQKLLKEGIKERFSGMFQSAAIPLFTRLGAYCSFCGNIISTYIEVEHCVPKAIYPFFTVTWDNFLAACGPCNQLKGNKPLRALVQIWLQQEGNNNPTEQDYYDCIRERHYVWADLDELSYRDLPSDLWYFSVSNNTWVLVPAPGNTDINNTVTSTDVGRREIYANINLMGTMVNRKVEVKIRSNTNPSLHGQELIDLCQLNRIGDLSNTSDRRLFSRTQAYFTALQVMRTFSVAIGNQQIFDLLWPNYLAQAKSSGFYSVFLRLLDNYYDPSGTPLNQRFVTETNNAFYFPNTNTIALP